jgi:hypothetical protein
LVRTGVLTLVVLLLGLSAGPVGAAGVLTKAQYIAKLRAANVRSSKADDAAMAAFQSKTSTAAQIKTKLFAMGATHVAVGREFAALLPPRAAAKANADLARAEIIFGRQNEAIAKKLPASKAAIQKYFSTLKPPSGGTMLDRAIAELHAAGFKI